MIRVTDLDQSLDFWCDKMGMVEIRRKDVPEGKFTLVFLAGDKDVGMAKANNAPELELTYNWGSDEEYNTGRSWGHLAYKVDNIYETCQSLMDKGVIINRPPRDGRMAFVKSPDNISIELLQEGEALAPAEPWVSSQNIGVW
jgi:lactoylglutathione lyase